MMVNWKEALLSEGFIEVGEFRVELSLDNTFLGIDYLPRLIVYDSETRRWYVLRNPIPKGTTLKESWKNAAEVLERIVSGIEEPLLPDEDVSSRFARTVRKFLGNR